MSTKETNGKYELAVTVHSQDEEALASPVPTSPGRHEDDLYKENPLFTTFDKGTTGISEMIWKKSVKSMPSPGRESSKGASVVRTEEKLGLIKGVYLPTTQNILGVILFLRLPWIVANAGVILTTVIVLLCVGSTFLTSLSLSAIATNGTPPLCPLSPRAHHPVN